MLKLPAVVKVLSVSVNKLKLDFVDGVSLDCVETVIGDAGSVKAFSSIDVGTFDISEEAKFSSVNGTLCEVDFIEELAFEVNPVDGGTRDGSVDIRGFEVDLNDRTMFEVDSVDEAVFKVDGAVIEDDNGISFDVDLVDEEIFEINSDDGEVFEGDPTDGKMFGVESVD